MPKTPTISSSTALAVLRTLTKRVYTNDGLDVTNEQNPSPNTART